MGLCLVGHTTWGGHAESMWSAWLFDYHMNICPTVWKVYSHMYQVLPGGIVVPVRLHCERDSPKKHMYFYCGAVKTFWLFWDRKMHQLVVVQAAHLHLANLLLDLENVHVSTYMNFLTLRRKYLERGKKTQEDPVTHWIDEDVAAVISLRSLCILLKKKSQNLSPIISEILAFLEFSFQVFSPQFICFPFSNELHCYSCFSFSCLP